MRFIDIATVGLAYAYRSGKTGPAGGRIGWARFDCAETWPALLFALAAWGGIQGCFTQVEALRARGFSLLHVALLIFFAWWAYSFILYLAYWCGVQTRGAGRHDQRSQKVRRQRKV